MKLVSTPPCSLVVLCRITGMDVPALVLLDVRQLRRSRAEPCCQTRSEVWIGGETRGFTPTTQAHFYHRIGLQCKLRCSHIAPTRDFFCAGLHGEENAPLYLLSFHETEPFPTPTDSDGSLGVFTLKDTDYFWESHDKSMISMPAGPAKQMF